MPAFLQLTRTKAGSFVFAYDISGESYVEGKQLTEGITYVVIEFETQKTERIANEQELAKYGSISWFTLCNTYEQIID